MADLVDAAAALSAMVEAFPALPAPYVTVHNYVPVTVHLQARTSSDFEQWRTALKIPTGAVELKDYAGSQWLDAPGSFCGVSVVLTGYGIELDTSAPREVAAPSVAPLGQALSDARSAVQQAARSAAEAARSVTS
jgi:hypothetical protein